MEMSGQLYAPAAITPGETAPDTNFARSLVGRRVGMDAVAKRKNFFPYPESNASRPTWFAVGNVMEFEEDTKSNCAVTSNTPAGQGSRPTWTSCPVEEICVVSQATQI